MSRSLRGRARGEESGLRGCPKTRRSAWSRERDDEAPASQREAAARPRHRREGGGRRREEAAPLTALGHGPAEDTRGDGRFTAGLTEVAEPGAELQRGRGCEAERSTSGAKGAAQQVGPDGDAGGGGAGKLGGSNVQESALLRPHCERDEVIVRPGAGVWHRPVVPWLSHRAGDRSDSASGAH